MRAPGPDSSARERPQPIDLGLALLAVASGSSDAISYLTLGMVFTSAMTGNTALLSISLAEGHGLRATLGVLALTGFIVGAATAAGIAEYMGDVRLARILRPLFLLEGLYLGCFTCLWMLSARPVEGSLRFGLIVLSAAAMGIQSVIARRINAPGINTVVFTTTLSRIVTSITSAVVKRARPIISFGTWREIAIFLSYIIGATAAAILNRHEFAWLPMVPLGALVGAFATSEFDDRHKARAG